MTPASPEAWTEPANADLIAFLNARLDEDERYLKSNARHLWTKRPLREVEAKRRLIELAWDADQGDRILDEEIAREARPGEVTTGGLILRAMAAVWSDHPDYRADWKPLGLTPLEEP